MTIAYLANPNRLRWLASDDDAVVDFREWLVA